MERKLRVGIIAYELSALRGGPKFSFLVADQLQRAGFEVAMACVHHNREFLKKKFPFVSDLKIYSAKRTFLRDRAINLTTFWNHAPAIWEMCRDFKPDVCIELGGVMTSAAAPVLLGIPTLHYCHNPTLAYGQNYDVQQPLGNRIYQRFVWLLEIIIARRLSVIMANSNFTAKNAKACWGTDVVVVNPPTDTEIFLPQKKENVILCVGFYHPEYKFENMVEEFRKMKRSDYELYVVGPTHEQDDSRAFNYYGHLKKNLLDKNIHFLSNIDFKDLLGLYGRARFFWHPHGAHFGNIIVESQSAGCVTISFGKESGPGEIIRDGETGFVVETFEEMRQKTEQVINDSGKLESMGLAARENSKKFGVDVLRKKMASLIQQAVKRRTQSQVPAGPLHQ
jgi:glycosyltransferase involved in cell wall biosynthesis